MLKLVKAVISCRFFSHYFLLICLGNRRYIPSSKYLTLGYIEYSNSCHININVHCLIIKVGEREKGTWPQLSLIHCLSIVCEHVSQIFAQVSNSPSSRTSAVASSYKKSSHEITGLTTFSMVILVFGLLCNIMGVKIN